MNRKLFSIMCAFCFATMILALSQISANIATTQNVKIIEMRTFEVHLFEDSDEGAFFTLDDGSEWLRIWWEGPVYYLDVGQTIAIIQMTDNEAIDHWYQDYTPFWIILNPKENQSTVGIAFKQLALLLKGDDPVFIELKP